MPRTGTAEAVAWTVTACSPAADRICIGWTMVTVTVTRFAVAVAVPVAPMRARSASASATAWAGLRARSPFCR